MGRWMPKGEDLEHLDMDKVKDIRIDCDSFIGLLPNIDDMEIPVSVGMEIYEFSRCIGGDRNFKFHWDELHKHATDIDKAEELLKAGYYIDQWATTDYQTPLDLAVHAHNVEMVEFYVLNGARRGIRGFIKELSGHPIYKSMINMDEEVRRQLLDIFSPYKDEDPLIHDLF